jgi:uncharacterized protein YyaL (SSP411 family)
MTGQGGWPMSVFLTPDGKPFYGGTYFPDQPRHGLPSFRQVLEGVSKAWREQRAQVEQSAAGVSASIAEQIGGTPARPSAGLKGNADDAAAGTLDAALVALEREFDATNGGWGHAPKFPQPMTIEFLLRMHLRSSNARPLAMARRSLDAMAAGGIFDHLGGGFARYSTDAKWLVPHFEKMLYDNAQLARVYVHAWQITADPLYRQVAEETLEFVARDMTTADGGFAASLDADTDSEEGATYVWSKREIDDALGDDARPFAIAYGVTDSGNWEGHNILSRVADNATVARELEISPTGVAQRLAAARTKLFALRQQRQQPARDDKVLTAWNGLMIAALADAAVAFESARWADLAERAADLLLRSARDEPGRLRRSFKDGQARQAGVLEDYADLADGLLALYAATFVERWFVAARDLVEVVLAHFADPQGGFFDTADDHEALLARPKGLQDNALPSGNAMMVNVLLRLAALTGDERYRTAADGALEVVAPYSARYPAAFAQWLNGRYLTVAGIAEIAIIGDQAAPSTGALLDVVRAAYRPASVVALGSGRPGQVPLLVERAMVGGQPTAYVCRDFACRQPVTNPADLAAQL